MSQGGIVSAIHPGSLAEELELVPGDKIIQINDQKLTDIIDLSFALAEEEIEMLVEHADGEQEILCFDKDLDEELGAEFESAVFNKIRQCCNNCYFCFVDQVAPDMRNSLYIKDDDYRLSFLYGNFITLTNLGERDMQRIRSLHLSPLYVSVHTINPQLRSEMLRTPRAALINEQLQALIDADIDFHAQVVLCPGLNDKEELDRTIREIYALRPHAQTLGIVPVGLTKFRKGCYPLDTYTKETALEVVEQVSAWQKKFRAETGKKFVYLSDEFYLLAGLEIPPAEAYDGFPQLDNGIGLTRNVMDQWQTTPNIRDGYDEPLEIDVVCGKSAGIVFEDLMSTLDVKNLKVNVVAMENDFFGHEVTVSGLLTAQDIIKNLKNNRTGRARHGIVLPAAALREGEDIFLDDISLEDLKQEFADESIKIARDGKQLKEILTDWYNVSDDRQKAVYTWQSNAAYTK